MPRKRRFISAQKKKEEKKELHEQEQNENEKLQQEISDFENGCGSIISIATEGVFLYTARS